MNKDVWCPICRCRIFEGTEIDRKLFETLIYCWKCKCEFVFAKIGDYKIE